MLNNIQQAIKELDFFQHPSLLRYQTQPGYRTLTGGIISVALIIIFSILFSSEVIDTLTNMNANGQNNIAFETDPSSFDLKANAQRQHFMFALGIQGLNLNNQKYFDIKLQNFVSIKNGSGEFNTQTTVPLKQCNISQWTGVNDDITSSFNTLQFGTWLCPPTDTIFPLQGKYTSPTFKYSRILIQKCTSTLSSTCASQSQINAYINSNQEGVAVNFYYINPIINAGDINYLNYYLQDSNYFMFNTNNGVSANLYFSEYKITTDHSILPWEDISENSGAITSSQANSKIYSMTNNQYAKIYLRKASKNFGVTRKFAKIDQTLAFIGGLLGFILLILTFMNLYNKYCYEIEFGDRVFKQNSNGTFGSQNFNFIVFLGYGIYNILTIFGVHLKWLTMRKYHECRIECLKQLDIHLLFKKIEFFEEVSKIVLEDHHIKGIFMLPKKKIKQIQESRRRFLLQSLLYYQLDKKARQVIVEDVEYKKIYQNFFTKQNSPQMISNETEKQQQNDEIKKLKDQFSKSYKVLQLESNEGDKYSQKIFDKMGFKQVLTAIFKQFKRQNMASVQQPLYSIEKINIEGQNIDNQKIDDEEKRIEDQKQK